MPGGEYSKPEVEDRLSRGETCSVPLLIRSLQPGRTLRDVSSGRIRSLLNDLLGESLDKTFLTNDGVLIVHVSSRSAFARLKALTSIAGVPVTAELPRWFHHNAGKIKCLPRMVSENLLLKLFAPSGAIHVRRLLMHSKKEDGSMEASPTDQVVVHFWPDCPIPRQLKIGGRLHDVHRFLPPPGLDSRRRHGEGKERPDELCCKHCAGPHPYHICPRMLQDS